MSYKHDYTKAFAERMVALGFRAFIAKDGQDTYGIVTPQDGSRVMSFSFSVGATLGGNYGPPSRESGTGWGLEVSPEDLNTKADVERALASYPPQFCGKGWRYLTTLDQHLAAYQSSSRYKEVTQ